MSLISILIALVIAGVVLWLINTYIPMDGKIKKILNVVVVIIVIVWLLSVFGVFGSQSSMHIGNLHMRW
jgi:formate hydrogenlyase subunit 4